MSDIKLVIKRFVQSVAQNIANNVTFVKGKVETFLPLLIVDFGISFIYPFVLPQYPFYFAKVLEYSVAQFGVIVSVYGLSLAAFPIFLGRLSEVIPKKLLIICGSLL
jgi:MFS family permease